MHSTQLTSDKAQTQTDSVPLFFDQGLPRVGLPEARIEGWIVQFARELDQINQEKTRSKPYPVTAYPVSFVYDAPIYESTITSAGFEAHLTPGEETSTEEVLQKRIVVTFDKAKEQVFENGMESGFSRELVSFIKSYGNIAMRALANLILNEEVNAEVASEALRWLGQMEDPQTHSRRLGLLEQSLYCSSARVRDGAALGLAFLDDPRAIPDLREAIQREPYLELREDMEQVLEQLENSHRCRSS